MTGNPVQRRSFITLLGGAAAAWPIAARAQQDGRARRIGVLMSGAENDPAMPPRVVAFRQGLERWGWMEGRNVRIEIRYAQASSERQQALARELIALQPDAILAETTPVTAALQRETRTIPIVFSTVSDPIGSGFVASLARPGGNLTGFLLYEAGIPGKWVAMLKEVAPRVARVAFIADRATTPYDYFLRATEAAAQLLAIELVSSPVHTAGDIQRAIEAIAREPDGALLLAPSITNDMHRDLIIGLADKHRLPAVYTSRHFVVAGGLMAYDTDRVDMFRNAASYVNRILRGEKPADLPVQAPVKYQTILNLKTAKALGLTVPDLMIVRADEVIE